MRSADVEVRSEERGVCMEDSELQYRTRTNLAVAMAALLLLSPFAINNFAQGRNALGVGSALIVTLLAFNAWCIKFRMRVPWTTTFLLAPMIIIFLNMAFQRQGIVGALWCYPAVLSFYFMLEERQAWIMNLLLVGVAAPAALSVLEPALGLRVIVTILAVSVFSAASIRVINNQQRRLRDLAVTDSLTGLYNRTLLDSTLNRALEQSFRSGSPTSLLLLDLDHFKSINDSYGHDVGDEVLAEVSVLLRSRLRASDQVFRMGGEEFLAILHHTDLLGAERVGRELCDLIAGSTIVPQQQVTISGGVAVLSQGESWTEWLKRADECLYRAKRQGRNRVVCAN